jgi:hypothetical protein
VVRLATIQSFQQSLQQAAVLAQVVLSQSWRAAQVVLVALQQTAAQAALQAHQEKEMQAQHQVQLLVLQAAAAAQARQVLTSQIQTAAQVVREHQIPIQVQP